MDTDTVLIIALAWATVMGALGAAIGASRNRMGAGFAWGAVLGPLGWLVIWLGPTAREKRARPGNW